MGIRKHSEDDDQHGVPKFARQNWAKGIRKEAARQKAADAKRKASDKDGKGNR